MIWPRRTTVSENMGRNLAQPLVSAKRPSRNKADLVLRTVSRENHSIMRQDEKPTARGPTPSRKAHVALGPKLNRKTKEPPTFPGKTLPKNTPPNRRSTGK